MSIISSNILAGASSQNQAYNIQRSLRFRSNASAYLSRTPSVSGSQQKFTASFWWKSSGVGGLSQFISAYNNSTNISTTIRYEADGTLSMYSYNLGTSSFEWQVTTKAVYRDPSAWYHIVYAVDTTQSTASNRVKLFINGVQVTAFNTASYPSLNYNTSFNVSGKIGYIATATNGSGTTQYVDGYLAEFNFIDGQQLDASSFGETDATTGVWKPKKYTGTYGTNGFYLPFDATPVSSYAGNFSGSGQWLTVPANSALEFGSNNFTIEFWWYKTSSGRQALYHGSFGADWSVGIDYNSVGTGTIGIWASSNGTSWNLINADGGGNGVGTKQLINNGWNHIAYVRNGTTWQSYINGVLDVNLTGISGSIVNRSSYVKAIGQWFSTTSVPPVVGSLSNFRIVNGTALYTSNFTPSKAPLTAVANTQLLTLQNATIIDNSSNNFTLNNVGSVSTSVAYPFFGLSLTSDSSGNNNNWIASGISLTAGSTYDSMTDVPTLTSATAANYAVANPLNKHPDVVVTDGNMRLSLGSVSGGIRKTNATIALPTTGKYYWETKNVGSTNVNIFCGIQSLTASLSASATGEIFYNEAGEIQNNGSSSGAIYGTLTANDILGMAYDADANKLYFYKNNVLQNSSGSTPSFSGPYIPFFGMYLTNNGQEINFGQRPFAYTPPSGFKALNTYNLPTPAIPAGNKVMDATTWTGNSTARSITNTGSFKPDLVWIKDRTSGTPWHQLQDSIRGPTKQLFSNATDAENTDTNKLTSFDSSGFSLGTSGAVNASSDSYVGWQWQAGQGTTSTNTSGSITSTVSVNPSAGFSIVSYTGSGSAATIGHGLGVAPSLVILKSRTVASRPWPVYHVATGNTNSLFLNQTDAVNANAGWWNNTSPTSSVFSVGNSLYHNESGANYIAYCWAEVPGFSKFGSYTGNGSTDGPFVYTGFRPKFIMLKSSTNAAYGWTMWDTTRNTFNAMDKYLQANGSVAEDTFVVPDALSNGFKIRTNSASVNESGGTMIYIAFAENPFKYSLAR